jgi:hypothetical protein
MNSIHSVKDSVSSRLHDEDNFLVHGLHSSLFNVQNANTHTANSSQFDINIPPGMVLNRTMYISTEVKILLDTGGALAGSGSDFMKLFQENATLCQLPLQQCCKNLQTTINNKSQSDEVSRLAALNRYIVNDQTLESFSGSPAMNDLFNLPLAEHATKSYADSPVNYQNSKSRAAFIPISFDIGTTASTKRNASVTFRLIEPIFCPMLSLPSEFDSLANVNTIKFNFQWSNLNAMMSTFYDAGFTNYKFNSIEFGPNASILYQTYELNESIPQQVSKNYHENVIHQSAVQQLSTGSSTFYSRDINMSTVPSKIYVFCETSDDVTKADTKRARARITDINCRVGNKSGVFTNSNEYQLYQMSMRNGYYGSFDDFKRSGSIICIDVEKDLGGFIPESMSGFDIQFTVNAQRADINNIHTNETPATATNYICYFVFEMHGQLYLSQNQCISNLGIDPTESLAILQSKEPIAQPHLDGNGMRTAGSWKGFKRFLGKAVKYVPGVARLASNALGSMGDPRAQTASKVLGTVASIGGAGMPQQKRLLLDTTRK